MVDLLHATNGDGFNGDTMDHFNKSFWDVAVQVRACMRVCGFACVCVCLWGVGEDEEDEEEEKWGS